MGGASVFDTGKTYDWRSDSKVTHRSAKSYAADDKRVYTGNVTGGIDPPLGKYIKSDSEMPMVHA
jgi:hypothetical protein